MLIVLVLTMGFGMEKQENICYAKDENQDLIILSDEVPAEIEEYFGMMAPYIIYDVINNSSMYGVEIENIENICIGNAFIIYCLNSTNTSEVTYYFPVLYNEDIIIFINVVKSNDELSIGASREFVDKINQLGRNSEYVFCSIQDNVYAINASNQMILLQGIEENMVSDEDSINYEEFICDKKQVKITKEKDSVEFVIEKVFEMISQEQESNRLRLGFSENTYYVKKLDMTNRLVNQKDSNGVQRRMCWAASVATIVRYRNNNTTLTATNVCDAMNIGYDEGGSVSDAAEALNNYNVKYYIQNYQSSWDQVVDSINNQYPIHMSCATSDGSYRHAVTLMGYSSYGGVSLIYLWNPGSETIQSVSYSTNGSKFPYDGKTYIWERSAIYYTYLY